MAAAAIIFRYNAVVDGATALRGYFAACNFRSASKQKSPDSVEPAAHLSCRINIGGPLAPRMRAGASPISSARLATHYRLSLRPSEDATQHNAFNLISRSVSLEKRPRGASTGAHFNSSWEN